MLNCSVDPLASTGGVYSFEGRTRALVEDTLGLEALVLIVTVGLHAISESLQVIGAELLQDVLAGRAFILTSEANQEKRKESG